MATRIRARTGRLLAVATAVVALAMTLGGSVAMAATTDIADLDPAALEQLFREMQAAPVIQETCSACHGNIADTDNYAASIIFTHANHIMLQCASCHTRFPHRPEGTSRPTMKGCYDCHGLRHGPMGMLASDTCEDCHVGNVEDLRPASHPANWSGVAHVAPSKEFNRNCAMCHDKPSCDDCHKEQGISWKPESWAFDSSDGCLSCHGNPLLQKQAVTGGKSYQVTGLEDSVHMDVTCQQCHTDYRYDDDKAASPLWNINASNACADCHRKSEEKRLSDPVAIYEKSVHGKAIAEGTLDSATCGSCHGGHFIYSTKTDFGKARLHASSYRMCARCKQHGDEYDTYDDYYHGKAYKAGAPDAPACWDCHDSHNILPKGDSASAINEANIGETCGREGCHKGSTEKFGTEAGMLIHRTAQAKEENPLRRLIAMLFDGV